MAELITIREGPELSLKRCRDKEDVKGKRQRRLMGLFGGHRPDLGHDGVSTLMAIASGGVGIWWPIERRKLSAQTPEWLNSPDRCPVG